MRRVRRCSLVLALLLGGCASRSLPPFEQPIARTEFQTVRTTAYTHTERDHRRNGNRTALGTTLRSGPVHSAAADWSRWPAGTVFQILPDGPICEVDDFGWALSGTNTIDLYRPSAAEMKRWGTRRVTIRILQWGDDSRSYGILRPRAKYAHVARMIDQMEKRGLNTSSPVMTSASVPPAPTPARQEIPAAPPAPPRAVPAAPAGPAVSPLRPASPRQTSPRLQPFTVSTQSDSST